MACASGSSQGDKGYKQVKQELGWADFQVRADRAIRRHWALVCCAYCCYWWAERQRTDRTARTVPPPTRSLPLPAEPGAGEKWSTAGAGGDLAGRAHELIAAAVQAAVLAAGAARRAELA
jgi:hypothetical protein